MLFRSRQNRVRATVKGTSATPRLCVYKSLTNIYAQLIDDETRTTLVSASTLDKEVKTKASNVEAAKEVGLNPKVVPIRGGTDGARLSFMGLPCPNLGTGGFGFHGPYEHVTAEGMDLCVEMMRKIVEKYAKA